MKPLAGPRLLLLLAATAWLQCCAGSLGHKAWGSSAGRLGRSPAIFSFRNLRQTPALRSPRALGQPSSLPRSLSAWWAGGGGSSAGSTAGTAAGWGEPGGRRGRLLRRRKGNPFAGCNLWVSSRGTNGAFRRVQDAVDKAGKGPSKICIMPGRYYETVHIRPGQNNLRMVGSGRSTVIVGGTSRSRMPGQRTFYAATMVVEGDGFVGRRFGVENPSKTTWDPSPAVTLLGQRSQWYSVAMTAWIDTLGIYTSRHYFRRCYIQGLADIIWGFGRGAFEDSQVHIRKYYDPKITYIGYVTAFGTDVASNGATAGAVFWNCRVDGDAQAFLGRPYRKEVTVAYVHSYLGPVVPPGTWSDFDNYVAQGKTRFRQIGCYGPGASATSVQFGSTSAAGAAPGDLTIQQWLGW